MRSRRSPRISRHGLVAACLSGGSAFVDLAAGPLGGPVLEAALQAGVAAVAAHAALSVLEAEPDSGAREALSKAVATLPARTARGPRTLLAVGVGLERPSTALGRWARASCRISASTLVVYAGRVALSALVPGLGVAFRTGKAVARAAEAYLLVAALERSCHDLVGADEENTSLALDLTSGPDGIFQIG